MNKRMKKALTTNILLIILVIIVFGIFAVLYNETNDNSTNDIENNSNETIYNTDNIPVYNGQAYVELNNNIPEFEEEDFKKEPFEEYSELDKLGRCGMAFANICVEIMPKEERGDAKDVCFNVYIYNVQPGIYIDYATGNNYEKLLLE